MVSVFAKKKHSRGGAGGCGISSSYQVFFLYRAHFGQSRGPILLDNLRCVGTENELIDCIHPDVGVHNCRHVEDAGVSCTSKSTGRVWSQGCVAS